MSDIKIGDKVVGIKGATRVAGIVMNIKEGHVHIKSPVPGVYAPVVNIVPLHKVTKLGEGAMKRKYEDEDHSGMDDYLAQKAEEEKKKKKKKEVKEETAKAVTNKNQEHAVHVAGQPVTAYPNATQAQRVGIKLKDMLGNKTVSVHHMGEEVEQIDELAKDTLSKYIKSAEADTTNKNREATKNRLVGKRSPRHAAAQATADALDRARNKRLNMMDLARAKMAKEEVEQIDEDDLSVRTLYNKYTDNQSAGKSTKPVEKAITKVHGSKVMSRLRLAAKARLKGNTDSEDNHFEKARTLAGGSDRIRSTVGRNRSAFRKSMGEEVEQIDEVGPQKKRTRMLNKIRDARIGAEFKKSGGPMPDAGPEHKTARAFNTAVGRALRKMSEESSHSVVNNLKADGKHEEAGAKAFEHGLGRKYGQHFGLRSTKNKDEASFHKGYDTAEAKSKKKVNEEVKPYLSKSKKNWVVIDHNGKTVFSHEDKHVALNHLKKNYDKYRDPKHLAEAPKADHPWRKPSAIAKAKARMAKEQPGQLTRTDARAKTPQGNYSSGKSGAYFSKTLGEAEQIDEKNMYHNKPVKMTVHTEKDGKVYKGTHTVIVKKVPTLDTPTIQAQTRERAEKSLKAHLKSRGHKVTGIEHLEEAPNYRTHGSYDRSSNDVFDRARRGFKSREHEFEAEVEAQHHAAQVQRDSEPHHIYINGRVWKKDGHPVTFNNKKHANAVGLSILKKNPKKVVQLLHHSFHAKHGDTMPTSNS